MKMLEIFVRQSFSDVLTLPDVLQLFFFLFSKALSVHCRYPYLMAELTVCTVQYVQCSAVCMRYLLLITNFQAHLHYTDTDRNKHPRPIGINEQRRSSHGRRFYLGFCNRL